MFSNKIVYVLKIPGLSRGSLKLVNFPGILARHPLLPTKTGVNSNFRVKILKGIQIMVAPRMPKAARRVATIFLNLDLNDVSD